MMGRKGEEQYIEKVSEMENKEDCKKELEEKACAFVNSFLLLPVSSS